MSRQATLATLKEYFASKGKFMTMEEYKEALDAPVRFQVVKRTFGSWSRLKGLVGEISTKAAPKATPKAAAPKPAPKAATTAPEVEAPSEDG